jgi:putative transposase
VNGRKRHLLVDTGGLVLTAVVHPANIPDRIAARTVLAEACVHHLQLERVWADAGYTGALTEWARQELGLALSVVKRPSRWVRGPADQEPTPMPTGLTILPRRWVVERTFAWLGRNRRLSKDYEALPETEQAWIHLAMIRLMVARLAKP